MSIYILIHKTANVLFPALSHDQVPEQLNVVMEAHCMLAWSEAVHVLDEFQGNYLAFKSCYHKYHGWNPPSKEWFRYQGCHRIIWMCRQCFWENSANFTLDTKVMISVEGIKAAKEAETMGIELSYHSTESRLENQSESVYGNNMENNQPFFPTLARKKTSYDAHIDHKLYCTHATVKDKHCRNTCRMCLVNKIILPQLELIQTGYSPRYASSRRSRWWQAS